MFPNWLLKINKADGKSAENIPFIAMNVER